MLALIPEAKRLDMAQQTYNLDKRSGSQFKMSRLRCCPGTGGTGSTHQLLHRPTPHKSRLGRSHLGFRTFAGNLGQRADGLLTNLDVLQAYTADICGNWHDLSLWAAVQGARTMSECFGLARSWP